MKKYPSKIDIWLVLLVVIALIGSAVLMITEKIWSGVFINGIVLVFTAYLFINTFYAIDQGILKICCGFIVNHDIPIDTILSISETRNPISAPAASLDRLEIFFAGNRKNDIVTISPKDKDQFIDHLLKINNNITVKRRDG